MAGIESLRIPEQELGRTLIISGGKPLEGEIALPGAKNFALQAMAVSVLTDETITLDRFPNIADTQVISEILSGMGAGVVWNDERIKINTAGINSSGISTEQSTQTSGIKHLISGLVTRFGEIQAGPPGGDHIGAIDRFRFTPDVIRQYQDIGIGHREIIKSDGSRGDVLFDLGNKTPEEKRLEKRYFGPTIQALLRFAGSDRDFTIINPNIEPEVGYTIDLLRSMGADIEYDPQGFEEGNDQIRIRGRGKLSGTEFPIFSDPNALVSYAAMGLISNGEVKITGIDHNPKIEAFIKILEAMNAEFRYDTSGLTLNPSLGNLTGIDLTTDFWPAGCHSDWQQLLTPLLAVSRGKSVITEQVYPRRFTHAGILNFMGADLQVFNDPSRLTNSSFRQDGLSHSLLINGDPTLEYFPTSAPEPRDVRGATGVLVAMLGARGQSRINGAKHLFRGLGDVDSVLRSLGANVIKF